MVVKVFYLVSMIFRIWNQFGRTYDRPSRILITLLFNEFLIG